MRVEALGRAFPEHYYEQETLLEAFREMWGHRFHNPDRLEQLHRNVLVGGRHLALPLEEYRQLATFGAANDAFIRVATDLGRRALGQALERAGLEPGDLDHLFFVSVTGISTPSIDARLINRMGLRRDIKRTPIFGLGCVAGAAGISRVADYLRAFPDQVAALLSVELCSLTLQQDDASIANLIACGLFGDGAAAVVLTGEKRNRSAAARPSVRATRSVFYPDTERVMGWEIGERGFRVVLGAEIPEMVLRHLRGDVDDFLAEQGLGRRDIAAWICHPGGPKVLAAYETALEIPRTAVQRTWDSLAQVGNLSSASVLLVLADTLEDPPATGAFGLMLAMGPGFCAELVLLQW